MISIRRRITTVFLMVALSFAIVSCSPVAPVVQKDPFYLPPDAHDMDKVVNMKGIPLVVREQTMSVRGKQVYDITLMYSDQIFNFKTNADHSLTRTELSFSSSGGLRQMPLPAWFKVKYPHLDYSNIPTAP